MFCFSAFEKESGAYLASEIIGVDTSIARYTQLLSVLTWLFLNTLIILYQTFAKHYFIEFRCNYLFKIYQNRG